MPLPHTAAGFVIATVGAAVVFTVTAIDEADNSAMAIRHKEYDVRGVQFHPESILTEYGKEMMKNWLS